MQPSRDPRLPEGTICWKCCAISSRQLSLSHFTLKARLLVDAEHPVRRTSRRDAIHALGIAEASALPLLTSLVAPTPARAASCLSDGKPCVNGAQCWSGKCGVTSGHCGA